MAPRTNTIVNHINTPQDKDVIQMISAINVSVDKGFLRVIGEISIASSKEELEVFVAEIHGKLLGDKEFSKAPSFGLASKELCEAEAAIYIGCQRRVENA